MNKIPFLELKAINSKYIDDITQHCEKTIRSGWYVNGTQKKQFEENLARYNKLPYAIGTSNGYDSLRLIFKSLIITGKLSRWRSCNCSIKQFCGQRIGNIRKWINSRICRHKQR